MSKTKKKQESKKVQIARLNEELSKTVDNVERAIILGKIEDIKKEIKKEAARKVQENTKLNAITEAPVVMDRKARASEPYNGHNRKSVNGVYQNDVTRISW